MDISRNNTEVQVNIRRQAHPHKLKGKENKCFIVFIEIKNMFHRQSHLILNVFKELKTPFTKQKLSGAVCHIHLH